MKLRSIAVASAVAALIALPTASQASHRHHRHHHHHHHHRVAAASHVDCFKDLRARVAALFSRLCVR